MGELTLYYSLSCPYCVRVLQFMRAHGIETGMAPTTEPENARHLTEVGGKNQVPCLFINGEALYESNDIIAYLQKRFVDAPATAL